MDKKPLLAIEIDGFAFYNENLTQTKRDGLKNSILAKYNLAFLRLNTIGSNEEKRIVDMLAKILYIKKPLHKNANRPYLLGRNALMIDSSVCK